MPLISNKTIKRFSSFKNTEAQLNYVSSFFLVIKICIFLMTFVSLFKVGYVSKIRITRLREMKSSYSFELARYKELSDRFDNLFSVEGEQRFMKDQDQMISRDIIRVIWR